MWAIYWRYLLAIIIVFSIVVMSVQQLALLAPIQNSGYHPTAFWLYAAAIASLLTVVTSNGLTHAIFGKGLNLSSYFWQLTNFSFIALFLCLALLAFVAQAAFSSNFWGYFKLYFQPALLVLWPLLAGSFSLHQVKHIKPSQPDTNA